MSRDGALEPGAGASSVLERWGKALVRGDRRASLLCFFLLTVFFLATAAGNLSETDDVYAFAYRAEHFELGHLTDPRLMLYHVGMRLLFLGASGLGLDVSALVLMRTVSALCAAGLLLVVMRLVHLDLKGSAATAVLAAALLASCYGFWRYAAEAEVYIPAILLILLVFRGISALVGATAATEGRLAGAGIALAWGSFAGLAVLFYQPSLIPLFLAFPLLLAQRKTAVQLLSYLLGGGGVIVGGYLAGFLAFWPEPLGVASFVNFLSQRSNEFIVPPLSLWTVFVSVIRAAFALTHDIVAANWIFAIDPLADLVQRAFYANVITEEIFLARRAGFLAYLPVATLLLLAAAVLRMIFVIWPLSLAALRQRPVLVLVAWIAVEGIVIGRLNPSGLEAWIMVLPPLALVLAVTVIEPGLRKGAGRLIGASVGLLFLHNAVGGMALVFDPSGEYDRVKGAWVIEQAQPGDLVIVAGNAGLVESLRYLSPAEVALVGPGEVPDIAESLLAGDLSRLIVRSRGRDFSNRFLRSLVRDARQAGGRLVVFDDFFDPFAGRGPGDEVLSELRARAQVVYESPDAGSTYVLPAPVR